jgi:hydroxymethylbilane synthase
MSGTLLSSSHVVIVENTGAVSALRIGTRGSALALWQARHIQNELGRLEPECLTTLEIIRPEGDLDKVSSLTEIGGRGVFSSALQRALLEDRIDLAVHSTKDVPTLSPHGLVISAFPVREDARDVLVSRHGTGIAGLPDSPLIGTSSRRRAVQILAMRPDAVVVELRGNIDTRLRKAASNEYDAVVLAAAGLLRMGWEGRITEYLPIDRFTPSPGQGALAIETRTAPDATHALVQRLDDPRTSAEVSFERRFLTSIGGGCSTPVGAHARLEVAHGREVVRFWGMLASEDGGRLERAYEEFPLSEGERVVTGIAHRLMQSLAPAWEGSSVTDPGTHALAGRQVLTTGTYSLAESLQGAFGRLGAIVTHQPTITVEPTDKAQALEHSLADARCGVYDWVILTSENAIDAAVRALVGRQSSRPVRIAAVGAQTTRRLRERGIDVDVAPVEDQRTGGLLAALDVDESDLQGRRVLCLLGNRARSELADGLRERGAQVDVVEAYRTLDVTEPETEALALIRAGKVDIVTFGSPSSVESLARLLGADLAALSGACLVAIGPTTATAMDVSGLTAHVVATVPGAEGIVQSVEAYLTGTHHAVKDGPR